MAGIKTCFKRPSHICKHFHPSCLNKHSHENKLVLDKCLHEIKVFPCDVLMRTKCSHAMFSWKQNVLMHVLMQCSHENKMFARNDLMRSKFLDDYCTVFLVKLPLTVQLSLNVIIISLSLISRVTVLGFLPIVAK